MDKEALNTALAGKAVNSVRDLAHTGVGALGSYASRAGNVAGSVADQASRYARQAGNYVGSSVEQAGRYVGEHGKAFGTAGAGAGVLGIGGAAHHFTAPTTDAEAALTFGARLAKKSRKFLGMGDDENNEYDNAPNYANMTEDELLETQRRNVERHMLYQRMTARQKMRRLKKLLAQSRGEE